MALGEKLLTRMWVTLTEKGIGKLLSPWQTVREAKAHAEAMKLLAQAEVEIEEMRYGLRMLQSGPDTAKAQQDTDLLPLAVTAKPELPAANLETARAAIENGLLSDAARREVNVAKTLLLADELLESDTDPPPAAMPSDDWLYRWRDSAGEVSEPDLQRLWAKVIAGEFKSPGEFSLRTLELIRNLSREEAAEIEKLAPFLMNGEIYRGDPDLLDQAGIGLGFLLTMQDLGILAGVESTSLSVVLSSKSTDKYQQTVQCHGKVLIVEHEDASRKLQLRACLVTRIGRDIMSLGTFEPQHAYLTSIGRDVVGQGFRAKLADCRRVPEGLEYFNATPIDASGIPNELSLFDATSRHVSE